MSPLRGQYFKGVQWKNDLSPDETTEERSKLCDIDRSSPVIQKYLKSSGEERSKSIFEFLVFFTINYYTLYKNNGKMIYVLIGLFVLEY